MKGSQSVIKRHDLNLLESQILIQNYFLFSSCHKLQIGCGNNIHKGWLNTDLRSNKRNGIAFLDAGSKFPFDNKTFEYIFSEHLFEHLTLHQALNMLNESYRVLKTDGYIRIATPDLDFLIRMYLYKSLPIHKEYIGWSASNFCKDAVKLTDNSEFLSVYVINNFFKDWGHQIIYNFETLSNLLLKAGFKNITKAKVGDSEIPALRNLEMHGENIPQEYNELETMVIEARK